MSIIYRRFFFQAEDGIRDFHVTGVQTCALPIYDGAQPALDPRDDARRDHAASHAAGAGARLLAEPRAPEGVHRGEPPLRPRSEERRVGKECTSQRWRAHDKPKDTSSEQGTSSTV